MEVEINSETPVEYLFSEELGLVVEIEEKQFDHVIKYLQDEELPVFVLGRTTPEKHVKITSKGLVVLEEEMIVLRDIWNATSFQLELLQANPHCVQLENTKLKVNFPSTWKIFFLTPHTSENFFYPPLTNSHKL
jgi:phosphoribosylformylglycinamidine synthase